MAAPKVVNCPRCGVPVEWAPEHQFRPFCSNRCKLIDLGAWANESYRVPVKEPEGDGEPAGANRQHT